MPLKRFPISLVLLAPLFTEAQTTNEPIVSFQSAVMPMNSPYQVQSLMFGIKSPSGDQFLIGPAYKSFLSEVGHKKSYTGLKVHAHVMIGRFAPFVGYELMWGKYHIWGGETAAPMEVKSRKQGKGVAGIGFAISDSVQMFAGVAPQDYDPVKFYKRKKTPYRSPGVVLKFNVRVWE